MQYLQVSEKTKPKGLENIGATCYMNSVLQCFYHIKALTNELLKINSPLPMTSAYLDAIRQLSNNSIPSARPIAFKNVISLNPLFTGIQANDSKDLILYFLETIENELTVLNYFCQNQKYFNRIRFIENRNEPELNNIITLFENTHKSVISDLFYGFKSQLLECKNCHKKLLNYQIFNIIIFPIEQVYNSLNNKTTNEKYNNYYRSNNEYGSFYNGWNSSYSNKRGGYGYGYESKKKVTIEECFENEVKDTEFSGENQVYCNICNKLSNAKSENRIYSTPHIFILVLNRGKGNQFDCDVEFPENNLDIRKYVEKKDVPVNYNLVGVISHLGESSMNGHFIADCKHFDGRWYTFSDSSVSGPSFSYSKKGTPYILFYQNKEL